MLMQLTLLAYCVGNQELLQAKSLFKLNFVGKSRDVMILIACTFVWVKVTSYECFYGFCAPFYVGDKFISFQIYNFKGTF